MRDDTADPGTSIDLEFNSDAIAVIGMAGRFPGANSPLELWKLVRDKKSAIPKFSNAELEDTFDEETRNSPDFVATRPLLENADLFDAEFFRMYPKEAALTDPQFRVFLEICWEAIEQAGYEPGGLRGLTGVFGGCSMSTYFLHHVLKDRETLETFTNNYQVGQYPMLMGSLNDTLATRVAYKLDLRGPAMSIQSACSTSLLAIAQACQSLSLYQCDTALAGGVSITFPQKRGYLALDGGMVSADGVCRPFDAGANGTIFGSGAGVVLLKRIPDAIEDGDNIIALIRGYGISNDGAEKVGFTAPSVAGQAEAIRFAHDMAQVEPGDIGYIECHGTATPLGDPIEFEALKQAFGAQVGDASCALGTVKANVGHLDAAAGVTGLIQAALAIHNGEIPPLLNYTTPNPGLELDRSAFFIPTEPRPWPRSDHRRMAGVSSFGVGGTNVHVVLEEAPKSAHATAAAPADEPFILPISARSEAALGMATNRLAEHIESHPEQSLRDVAHTLQVGRRAYDHRMAIVATAHEDAVQKLRSSVAGSKGRHTASSGARFAFMFPGQGAQYPGMARQLYEREAAFRATMDTGSEILAPHIGLSLVDLLYGNARSESDDAHPIRSTLLAQPALFLVGYALGDLLKGYGVKPDMMIGHSVGEFVAAALAGVFSFEDGLRLIAARGRLMQEQPGGAMLAVRAGETKVRELLTDGVEIAALNAPNLSVVAGSFNSIEAFERSLEAAGVTGRRLHTSHAFHSEMMTPVCEPLAEFVAGVRLSAPQVPYVSCVSGDWIKPEEATDPHYWAQHCRQTVRFSNGLQTLRRDGEPVLIELGPGRTLATFAQQAGGGGKGGRLPPITTLPDFSDAGEDDRHFLDAIGKLWSAHAPVKWDQLKAQDSRRVPLPTYPFERKRHWIDAPTNSGSAKAIEQDSLPQTMASAPADATQQSTAATASGAAIVATPSSSTTGNVSSPAVASGTFTMTDRKTAIQGEIFKILEALSGTEADTAQPETTFVEMGFDSLFLGQLATEIRRKWQIKLAFRQLLRDFPSPASLATHLIERLPDDASELPPTASPVVEPTIGVEVLRSATPAARQLTEATVATVAATAPVVTAPSPVPAHAGGALEGILRDQLATMQSVLSQQLSLLQGSAAAFSSANHMQMPVAPATTETTPPPAALTGSVVQSVSRAPNARSSTDRSSVADGEPKSRFDAYKGVKKSKGFGDITAEQLSFIEGLVARYVARTPGSKARTQEYRRVLADPRTANGFRQEWKEMVYPLVVDRSAGSKVWDVDGNVYVDLVNGYGPIAFGHSPDFVQTAIAEQLASGFATGPQSPLAGEVAQLFAEITGNERVTFCNTGSEAVMAAMRLARTVTGRNKVVAFAGSYHGQFDEVIIHGRRTEAEPGAMPAAIGIPPESIANMIVLPYGTLESLDYIRANAGQLAAVLVETVQSRHPGFLPREFIQELREITAKSDTALVFDEVVTGFRAHPAGMQGYLGIRADLATYGKVVGGGMPIGVLAGKAEYMDALDGGYWQFGDDSSPEVAPTFFAGTFVRHPLVLAAVKAVLEHIKSGGQAMLSGLSERTAGLVRDINRSFSDRQINVEVGNFSSFFFIDLGNSTPLASLFFPLMRLKGVHIQEGFPCYMTTAHDDADLALIKDAVEATLDELAAVGILGQPLAEPSRAARAEAASKILASEHALEQVSPLTEAQREVWLAAQMSDAASCAFNESASLRLEGRLDVAALALALSDVVDRHDALRASFGNTGERMRIAPSLKLMLEQEDLTGEADPAAALTALIADDAATPFDLSSGPPVRAVLARQSADVSVLVLTAHHIVCDGWSMNILLDDLAHCYDARRTGRPTELPPAKSFLSYAQERAKTGREDDDAEAFWLAQFQTIPALPDLPADRPRPERRSYRGGTYTARLPAALTDQVRRAGAKQKSTLFACLFSTFQVLAGRLANQEDIVVAVPTAGQSLVDNGESLVGHCVNFLPLRKAFSFEDRFSDHLTAVSSYLLDAFEHQQYTLGTLVRKLDVKRDLNRLPLTELQFNLEKMGEGLAFAGLEVSASPNGKAYSNYDIFFNVIESKEGLRIDCDYNADIYDAETIRRFIQNYQTLLEAFVADPNQIIGAMPLADRAERDKLIEGFNATSAAFPAHACVHDLIREQAAATPDRVAAVFRNAELTFGELEARANGLACRIAQSIPGRGARIAVGLERSLDMLVALLAVMKSGHTYVPLDPDHPDNRLQLVIETARISGVLCDSDKIAKLTPEQAAVIDLRAIRTDALTSDPTFMPAGGDPQRAAYVIFTSGSTGVPKGVEVPHRAVVNFLKSMAKTPGFTEADTIVAVTTISFDIAVLELYLPLITGGRVVIASKEDVVGGFGLAGLVQSSHATALQATPSLWRMLLEAKLRPARSLKMLCGGEPLPRDLADSLLGLGGNLWNMYGPTETTVWSSVGQVEPGAGRITIGQPIDNTQLIVLDDRRQLCPVGLVGHLYIGGDGLATGYFDRPDLTEQAFDMVSLDGRAPQRLYRTGDLAVRRADGSLELLGRIDHQIKLRGFRIELEDIETALRKQPGVAGAAVALRSGPDGQERLVGFFVSEQGRHVSQQDLAEGLARTLPDYMIPSAWLAINELPLTPNGKLDRKALPDASASFASISPTSNQERAIPETATEKSIAAVWSEVLGIAAVGTRDSLFSLGADSLQLFRIAARLADRGVPVEAKHLLQHPRIAELAAFVDNRTTTTNDNPQGAVASLRDFRHGARRRARMQQM